MKNNIIGKNKWIHEPVITSSGNKNTTHNKLNISWTVAPANARRNWFLSAIWPIATIVLVTDVPMLAPIVIGMAVRTVKTTEMRKWKLSKMKHPIGRIRKWKDRHRKWLYRLSKLFLLNGCAKGKNRSKRKLEGKVTNRNWKVRINKSTKWNVYYFSN